MSRLPDAGRVSEELQRRLFLITKLWVVFCECESWGEREARKSRDRNERRKGLGSRDKEERETGEEKKSRDRNERERDWNRKRIGGREVDDNR